MMHFIQEVKDPVLAEKKPKEPVAQIKPIPKRITLRQQFPAQAKEIEKEHLLTPITSRILAARGFVVSQKLSNYISPTYREGLAAPSEIKNMDQACALIAEQARKGISIAICCDFDVDGLSGGALLHDFFNLVGLKSKVFVPDRFKDGYGLNQGMIEQIAQEGFGLVITIDYGTTNIHELQVARDKGLKTIVVDHHHVAGDLPPCDVFINPSQPGCGFADKTLCASGLAWYLVLGLKNRFSADREIDPKHYIDLACLGTICDMVPLLGANRVIAKRGLEKLSKTTRPGLVALKQVIGLQREVDCYNVSFGIGPRLNAAGRMVNAEQVIELLTTNDSAVAERIARRLNALNAERQETEVRVKDHALNLLAQRGPDLPAGIVVWDQSFHTGVLGIVAQRLAESCYRPTAVLGADTAGIYKGSVRGIKGFNVVGALQATSQHLLKFGGHEGAAGFSILADNLAAFTQAFENECATKLAQINPFPEVSADTEAYLSELNPDLICELKRLAPFGMGNPGPQLLIKKLRVMQIKVLKSAHLKMTLHDGKNSIAALLWRTTEHPALLPGAYVNVVGRPEYNQFAGVNEIQLNLQAVEKTA